MSASTPVDVFVAEWTRSKIKFKQLFKSERQDQHTHTQRQRMCEEKEGRREPYVVWSALPLPSHTLSHPPTHTHTFTFTFTSEQRTH